MSEWKPWTMVRVSTDEMYPVHFISDISRIGIIDPSRDIDGIFGPLVKVPTVIYEEWIETQKRFDQMQLEMREALEGRWS